MAVNLGFTQVKIGGGKIHINGREVTEEEAKNHGIEVTRMSTKYKDVKEVPSSVLAKRLEELSDACVERMKGNKLKFKQEFTFRIPAEVDRDADIVLQEAALRILENET